MSSPPTVTLEEVKRGLAEKSIFLVDVCNLIVGEEKIPGSKNIPRMYYWWCTTTVQ